ncbi:MAG: hypothetical protein ACXVCD_17990 [Pseudobdellovibrionaceae bacterium]
MLNILLFNFIFTLAILSSCVLPAQAEALRCETLFQTPTNFQGCYINGMCPDNIFHLFRELKAKHPHDDFSKTQVLYLYSRWTTSLRHDFKNIKFKPLRSRDGKQNSWHFHVILLHQGLIYDYDYDINHTAVPVAKYFKDMLGASWSPSGEGEPRTYHEATEQTYRDDYDEYDDPAAEPGARLRMHVRAIPANVYLQEYSFNRTATMGSPIKSYAYWIYGDSRFPDESLEDFLERVSH